MRRIIQFVYTQVSNIDFLDMNDSDVETMIIDMEDDFSEKNNNIIVIETKQISHKQDDSGTKISHEVLHVLNALNLSKVMQKLTVRTNYILNSIRGRPFAIRGELVFYI